MMHLLKKELSELLNKQMLMGLMVSFILIILMGSVMTSAVSQTIEKTGEVNIIDLDQTDFTKQIVSRLTEDGYTVNTVSDTKSYEIILSEQNWDNAAVLPEGMTDLLLEQKQACEIDSVAELKNTSAVSTALAEENSAVHVTEAIHTLLSEIYLKEDIAFLENPVTVVSYTSANGKITKADNSVLMNSLSVFDKLMPMVLFLLIILTSQTLITAVAAEKTDKTLETLLVAPVPRSKIINAKMTAALIVALIYAAVYGTGFYFSIFLKSSDMGETTASTFDIQTAIQELNLNIPFLGWVGVVCQLFLTLGIALTTAMILGGLVEDTKGSQTASLPILVCTMFPYILSMVFDIRSMDSGMKYLVYCIPFTHTFIAVNCFRFHDIGLFWGGLIYQAIFLTVIFALTIRLYQSDMLFTHRFANRRKSK